MREYLQQALTTYETRYNDKNIVAAFRLFAERNSEVASRSNLAGHVTGSALVWHRQSDRVLRVHHVKLNCLVFSAGGHIAPNEMPWECAIRELKEETGIEANLIALDTTVPIPIIAACQPVPANIAKAEPAHWHYDMIYLFEVTNIPEIKADPDEIAEFVWMMVDEVTTETNSPVNLRQQMLKSGL